MDERKVYVVIITTERQGKTHRKEKEFKSNQLATHWMTEVSVSLETGASSFNEAPPETWRVELVHRVVKEERLDGYEDGRRLG
jgi:hypothetical protein